MSMKIFIPSPISSIINSCFYHKRIYTALSNLLLKYLYPISKLFTAMKKSNLIYMDHYFSNHIAMIPSTLDYIMNILCLNIKKVLRDLLKKSFLELIKIL